jgi:hypothetical protein
MDYFAGGRRATWAPGLSVMPRITCALVLLLVFASAATGVPVHASTECERWVAEYRDQLAHSDLMKRANAASHRLHHYVHRKVAAFSRPKPHPRTRVLPARLQRPKMTREEMLRELEFACGELPIEPSQLSKTVSFEPAPAFLGSIFPDDDSVAGPVQDGPQGLLASNNGPSGGWNPGMGGGLGGVPGGWGGGGGGIGGNNPPSGGNGGDNPPPPPPPPPGPPTAVAPEPGSLLLVATGVLGAAGAVRRRFRVTA